SAASNKRPTTTRGAVGQELDLLHAIGLTLAAGPERWTAMEGGYPILVDGDCLGGIGVSGGDWQQDQEIAAAALSAVGLSAS
ncbi:MAG TPA: heme-binding protein, partial [Afifellaceae bacterium]|nr:heme-binding protein [Afifellaceae bacterium]